jgi:UV DNA damage endonuclease
MLAELIGADVINIHAGGVYGNKDEAVMRFKKNFELLSDRVKTRLTIENDDRSYTPADLLPLCRSMGIPFVYDVHHHRCLADGMTTEEATVQCCLTWKSRGAEPYFHISSPRNGWHSSRPQPHADYIDPADFPTIWHGLNCTVDVEAKAKELAVLQLKNHLDNRVLDIFGELILSCSDAFLLPG